MNQFASAKTGVSIPVDPRLSRVAIGALLIAAMTSTWGGIVLPFGTIADMVILIPAGIVGLHILGGFRCGLRFWIWIPPIAIVVCLTLRFLIPAPYYILVTRYQLTPYAPNNFGKGVVWIVALLLIPILVVTCSNWDRRFPRWLMAAYVVGTSASCVVAITDVLGITALSEFFGTDNYTSRQSGLSVHANMLGFTSALSIPLMMYFLVSAKRKWPPAIGMPILFAGVVLSGSRAVQAASLVILLICTLLSPNKRAAVRQLAVTIGVTAATVSVALFVLNPKVFKDLFRIGETNETVGSDTSRLLLAKEALRDIQQYPVLGLGLKHIVEAHNIYLQLFAAGGILLAIPVLFYWGFIVRDCLLLTHRGVGLAPYLGVYMLVWLVVGVVENQLTDRLLYYAVGCIAALASLNLTASSRAPAVRGPSELLSREV